MAELKTKPTDVSVVDFLAGVTDEVKRADSQALIKMMQKITRQPPKMWGLTMIGFGTYHYVYASGHEGDTFLTGFSLRKAALTIYLTCACADRFADKLPKLGKVKVSKGCLYIKKLADVDLTILHELIETQVTEMSRQPNPKSPSKENLKPTPDTKSKTKP